MDRASSVELRAAIVAEARTWLHTPYHHQQSAKGAGCDCLGLVRGVYRAVIGPEPAPLPAYTPDWAETAGEETLLAACKAYLREIEQHEALPGDVVLFRLVAGAPAKHVGIISEGGFGREIMIHAYEGVGAVIEQAMGKAWWRRCVGAFAFPGA